MTSLESDLSIVLNTSTQQLWIELPNLSTESNIPNSLFIQLQMYFTQFIAEYYYVNFMLTA